MVVGTRDGTTVTFTPVGHVTGDPSGDPPDPRRRHPHGHSRRRRRVSDLQRREGEDLTGAAVTADAPVAVFAGNISTTYGSNVTGINSADMAHEQMPPVTSWSKS